MTAALFMQRPTPQPTSGAADLTAAGRAGGGFAFTPSNATAGGWSGSILNLRRVPAATFSVADLCPELGNSADLFKTSKGLARYRSLLAEITEADKNLAEFKAKAADAEAAAVKSLAAGYDDVTIEVAADAAAADFGDMRNHRQRLVLAAQKLHAELVAEWQEVCNRSLADLLQKSVAAQQKLKAEISAALQPLLDKLNREVARFQKLNSASMKSFGSAGQNSAADLIGPAPPRE